MPMPRKQKIEKLIMRKVATSRKSKNHNRQSKTRHISVRLVFDCDFEDALLTVADPGGKSLGNCPPQTSVAPLCHKCAPFWCPWK